MAARALIVAEKECPVFPVVQLGNFERTAHGETELVLLERLPGDTSGIGEKVIGVQLLISQELEHAAMKLIRAGLDGGADDRARRAAELRAEIVCLDLELFDRIDRRCVGDAIAADVPV